jgi:prepilin peptidase CpaA
MSVVWVMFVVVGLLVAVTDATAYRIPNLGLVALCVLFVAVAAVHGTETSWLYHLGAGALCLGAGIVLFAFGHVGAGDAKLFAALSLWSGFKALVPLLFCVAFAGLVQLVVILCLRRAVPALQRSMPQLRAVALPRILMKREGIPLGAGIVFGAFVATQWFPDWLWLGHLGF